MKIYTRKGDGGKTGLAGGLRVDKDHIRIECLGEMDEANSRIGHLRAKLPADDAWQERLRRIQMDFMNMMSHVARPDPALPNPNPLPVNGALQCEAWIDEMEAEMGPSDFFLLPGGTEVAALCHLARTGIRSAERRLTTLARTETVTEEILSYINRMSDLFFVLARYDMFRAEVGEERWNLFRYRKHRQNGEL